MMASEEEAKEPKILDLVREAAKTEAKKYFEGEEAAFKRAREQFFRREAEEERRRWEVERRKRREEEFKKYWLPLGVAIALGILSNLVHLITWWLDRLP